MRKSFTQMPQIKDDKIFEACGVCGYINIDGKLEDGNKIREMIAIIKDRENGLGGGFAAYGIFPDYKDQYCIQVLLDDEIAKEFVEDYLKTNTKIEKDEVCSTSNNISPAPIVWRYFIDVPQTANNPNDYVVDIVMHINSEIPGAFCLSSGKNMAVFKGNGWASEIAGFYQIQNYKAFMWLAHSRFPTNTPGWWGGAHPFNILDYSVVHNGEITSYGTNKRYLEMFNYKCTLLTDTEVVAYLLDLLIRKNGLSKLIACSILAPPYFDEIERLENGNKNMFKILRMNYSSAMLNGPFSILIGSNNPMPSLIGLSDRKKLRPLIAAVTNDQNTVYLSSEEGAIKYVDRDIEKVWTPTAGVPVITELNNGIISSGYERRLVNEV
ncbi:MAG: class II glutamine amidotransferase [Promethearchaeota archaeon]